MTERQAKRVLRRRLGPLVVLAKSAGRWSVILMKDERFGAGATVTDQCPTISAAVSQAIKWAIDNPGVRTWDAALGHS